MQPVTHQTVKLSRGKHQNPADGACVMELASMLAGESFSDRPRSVCRLIGALLRTYNDLLDDERRQDLHEYAARVVGTASSSEVERARAERVLEWADEMLARRRWAIVMRACRRLCRPCADGGADAVAHAAIRSGGRIGDDTHAAALSLIDELIALDSSQAVEHVPGSQPAILAADWEHELRNLV